ncbi:MAG: hypothetical protein U1E38_06485 [Rhodospirillales bacterium]
MSGEKVRLFVDAALAADAEVAVSGKPAHYLLHVMRLAAGDALPPAPVQRPRRRMAGAADRPAGAPDVVSASLRACASNTRSLGRGWPSRR